MSDVWNIGDSPLGFSLGTNQDLQRFESTESRGAANLLVKAAAALRAGDDEKATRLLDRVAGIPYNRRAETWPGPEAAAYLLFELITHVGEVCAEEDLDAWVDGIEAALVAATEPVAVAIRDGIAPVLHDWEFPRDIELRLGALMYGREYDGDRWLDPTHSADVVRAGAEASLRAAMAVEDELGARGLCAHLVPEYW